MPLAILSSANRPAFDKAAIMRRAAGFARVPLQICRARREEEAARRAVLSRALRRAWDEAHKEMAFLRERIASDARVKAQLAVRAREAVALAARFGNDPEAIRWEIQREHYRDRMDFARVDHLRAALASIGA